MSVVNTRVGGLTLAAWVAIGMTASLPVHGGAYRSIDGSGNNIANPGWGQADTPLLRLTAPAYDDGLSTPRGGAPGGPSSLPSARAISNAVSSQTTSVPNSRHACDWLWQWGQFIDHDLDLTGPADPAEPFNIAVPTGDPSFDPANTGTQEIGLNRSVHTTDNVGVRQQPNQISAYIDGSNVYGSDSTRADFLRHNSGGRLKTSTGDLLPFNTAGLPNAGGTGAGLFIAGDVRVNEQVGLTATHTLFLREHNRLADDIKQRLDDNETALVNKRNAAIAEPNNGIDYEDDFIYESARKIVGAQIQIITYDEFLPILLGPNALTAYDGYKIGVDAVDAGVSNEFSTAAYRVGHTLLPSEIKRVDNNGAEANEGHLALQDAFFNPQQIIDHGIDSVIMGLAVGQAQEVDTLIIDDVRNFLFGPPGAGGFDLASLNMQRGRDHGLPSLNDTRLDLGESAYASFFDLTGGDATLASALAGVYSSVNDVDLWIGGLAEPHVGDSMVGQTFQSILVDQFERTRDGDRFFYLNELDHLHEFVPDIESTTMSDIIKRNTVMSNIQANVFLVTTIPLPAASWLGLAMLAGLGAVRPIRRRMGRRA